MDTRLLSLLSGFLARRTLAVRSRRAFAAVGVAAIFGALAFLSFTSSGILWHDSGAASANTGGPEMVLNVKGGECDDPVRPTKCDVGFGSPFHIGVHALGIPANGYVLMQTFIDYGSDLVYKPAQPLLDEMLWPDRQDNTAIIFEPGPGLLYHGALTGIGVELSPFVQSTYVGKLVAVSMNCPDASTTTTVDLLPAGDPVAGTSGSLFVEYDTKVQFIPKVGSLTINCVVAPTPPPCPTGGCATPTPKVSATSTPTPAIPVESVSTTTEPDGSGILDTGTGDLVEVVVDVPAGGLPPSTNITVDVFLAEDIPEIVNDAVTFSRVFSFEPGGLTFATPATAVITYLDSEVVGLDEATLDVLVYNHATDGWELADVTRDPDNNTLTFEMDHFSHRLPLGRDGDQDGCPNDYELGGDEAEGGRRNPTIKWDYYDVVGSGMSLPRDHIIDLPNNILGVIQHFSPTGAPPYDVQFDRGPSGGPNSWNMTAPDGVIDLPNDILGVILQFFHDCREP